MHHFTKNSAGKWLHEIDNFAFHVCTVAKKQEHGAIQV